MPDAPREDGARPGDPLRVAILDDYHGVGEEVLASSLHHPAELTSIREHISDQEALRERLLEQDVVVVMRERTAIDGALIRSLPALRLIVSTGRRNRAIDVAAAREAGVVVCGTRSGVSPTVELTWALILALLRRLPGEAASVRDGGWQQQLGEGVESKRIGIIGLGRIGTRVAAVADTFGATPVAWSPTLDADRAKAAGCLLLDRESFFATSDVVTIHTKPFAANIGLIGRSELARMKPSAFLVNTARSEIVDREALVDALVHRRIAGAALDVHPEEPLREDDVMRRLDNVLATPHLGYSTRENHELHYRDASEAIDRFMAGSTLREITE